MKKAKPFLKWAGGKSQLIKVIENNLPDNIVNNKFTYIEPFVGSGAVLFWILNNFPKLDKVIISDINKDLIDTYKVIAKIPNELIDILEDFQAKYHLIENDEEAKKYFYNSKRSEYNARSKNELEHSALFIFLNKTCFNGLYRVNSKNEFNVPKGSYIKPLICDKENLLNVSNKLRKVEILYGDYEETFKFVLNDLNNNKEIINTFYYLDPPYKPINKTSNFNSYSKEIFDDDEQKRLMMFCKKLEENNIHWMLSNSDLKNYFLEDNFFDNLYSDFNIKRVQAKRSINSNAKKRGKLSELLITNYQGTNLYNDY